MTTILASTLSGTPVLGSDGSEIGTVKNTRMDVETGELTTVLVTPSTHRTYGFETEADGSLLVPIGRLRGIDDYLVIDHS
ncbi:PRC-barrel domain-containing protein [Natronobacterium texcoconense]|uniref:Sporulation protein YlmC, PRC-barrel domain family n=1 Tax=Natronobacterium texcoconense TaxID=1095778 RepID=A0A1H1B862_NATTX|nr:PRC-barrel domain-containing protein [Natronobacterium texcoconense]SDQ48154.1 Sporulation protein YlmC, PRC-barrel domain family [Natronobacterium texcoconense]